MDVIKLNIDLDHLDIFSQAFEVLQNLFSILLYTFYKQLFAISRGPDDVVFGLIYAVNAFTKSHAYCCISLPNKTPHRLDGLSITRQEPGVLTAK